MKAVFSQFRQTLWELIAIRLKQGIGIFLKQENLGRALILSGRILVFINSF